MYGPDCFHGELSTLSFFAGVVEFRLHLNFPEEKP